MTTEEFSEGFDTMVASYAHLQDIAQEILTFDEYEKSLFLTKAQEEVVKSLYTDSFEKTEAIRKQLGALVQNKTYSVLSTGKLADSFYHSLASLDANTWFVIYEQATSASSDIKCENEIAMDVYPITHDEYHKIRKNPFRGPNKRRVLRLDVGNLKVELIGTLPIKEYLVRYLTKPSPIVLVDLTDANLKIDGVSIKTECALSSSIHQEILARAVQLAIASRSIMNNNSNQ